MQKRFLSLEIAMYIAIVGTAAGRQEPVGLTNVKASCFMNAALQALLVTPFFQQLFDTADTCTAGNKELAKALKEFQQNYDSTTSDPYNTQSLYNLFSRLKIHEKGKTADAHEMIGRLFTNLDGCGNNPYTFSQQYELECLTCHTKRHSPLENNTFLKLERPLKQAGSTDLQQGLITLFRPQQIDGYNCDTCQAKRTIHRTLALMQLPETLMVLAHDCNYTGESVVCKSDPFTAPMTLDVKKWIKPRQYTTVYDLIAVVCHCAGGIGHYVALVRYPKQWYFCNDRSISTVPLPIEELITKKGGYQGCNSVLFLYAREKPHEIQMIESLAQQLSIITAQGDKSYAL